MIVAPSGTSIESFCSSGKVICPLTTHSGRTSTDDSRVRAVHFDAAQLVSVDDILVQGRAGGLRHFETISKHLFDVQLLAAVRRHVEPHGVDAGQDARHSAVHRIVRSTVTDGQKGVSTEDRFREDLSERDDYSFYIQL